MKKENSIDEQVKALVETINTLPTKERTKFIFDNLEDGLKNLRVGENDSVDGLVYVTKDLTQFKDIDGNRIINENSQYIEKLANSIRLIGVTTPILLNEEFGIADGQRRIAAIRRHGLPNPVPYIRKRGLTINEIGEINSQNIKWNYKDWLNRYEKDNREDYVEYAKLAVDWEKLMKSRSLRGLLMLGRVDALPSEVWERGQFHIDYDNLPVVRRYMEILENVYVIGGRENIFAKNRNFQKALYNMFVNTKKLNIDRLLVKLRTHIGDINVNYDYKKYKEVLARLYNTRLSSDEHHVVVENEEETTTKTVGNAKQLKMQVS